MIAKDEDGSYSAYAWPGGYPIYHVTADGGVLCADCANENRELDSPDDPQWHVIASDVNWESPHLYCDNCNGRVESAYADDES